MEDSRRSMSVSLVHLCRMSLLNVDEIRRTKAELSVMLD